MKSFVKFSIVAILVLSLGLFLNACSKSGGGGGGGGSTPAATATVSGKVTLSSTVSGAPAAKARYLKAMATMPKGKPGSKAFRAAKNTTSTLLGKTFNVASTDIPLTDAWVYLYDADHPEWLFPVAQTTTDSVDGTYTLTTMKNCTKNAGSNCTDNVTPIPAGNYTFFAWKSTPGSTKIIAVVQAVTTNLSGAVTVNLLNAVSSTATPKVITMFGLSKNTDGTQTWGSSSATVPSNAALQVTFNMPMWREYLNGGVSLSPAVSGHWSLSADWLTATFYPDSGSSFIPGTVYTVTVLGTGANTPVTNVFGGTLAANAVGTFTAAAVDTAAPSAIVTSPGSPSDVSITTPIRIAANKVLDVNTLLLNANPSLGAKPGVSYIGQDTTLGQYKYVYEFVLGTPLTLGQTFTITITGGKGVNGVVMNDLNYSFTTATAAASTGLGIDPTATAATQDVQAAVADVFGKWVRALSDRNASQLGGLMSPDFYMEYDTSKGIDSGADINRDGRYSYAEFTNMITTRAFPQWTYCGTTIDGSVVGSINLGANNTADFEFKLTATNTVNSAQCNDAAPKDSMYVTLQNQNGAWTIVRASQGIDTRTYAISYPDVLTATFTDNSGATDVVVPDGGTLNAPTDQVTWTWSADTKVQGSYIIMLIDQRDPSHGAAVAFPSSTTSFSPAVKNIPGLVDVSSRFGFRSSDNMFVQGGLYTYEVIGLGSTSAADVGNQSKTDTVILADVVSISKLYNFGIAGTFKQLKATVSSGSTPLTYNDNIGGYDAGSAGSVTIVVTTPTTTATTGNLSVYGSGNQYYPLNFTNGVATVSVNLYQGWNNINIDDGTGGTAMQGPSGLSMNLNITTTGGIAPVIKVTKVVDDKGNDVTSTKDNWGNYTTTTGSKQVTITGTVSDSNVTSVSVYLGNNSGAYSNNAALVTAGAFTVTVDIYQGDNWISFYGSSQSNGNYNNYNANIGVYTDTGTTWVPPFSNLSVSHTGATITETNDWGSGSDWDASSDTDNVVTVSGKLSVPKDGTYSVWSDGLNSYGSTTLNVLTDGSFSLDVTLYNGWTYLNLQDSVGNWYYFNIYTSAGKQVIKTVISTINGATYDGSYSQTVSTCQVKLVGTALVGDLNINWSGSDGVNSYYDSQVVSVAGTAGGSGPFTATIQIVGGTNSYNDININDANYKWTGLSVTTTGSCAYVAPVFTVDTVKDSAGTTLTLDTLNNYYNAGSSATISVSGTSNRAGRAIGLSVGVCGTQVDYSTTASTTETVTGSGLYAWTISGVKVYNNVNTQDFTNINIEDGYNWDYISVHATNGQAPPPPPLQISGVTNAVYNASSSGCGYSYWDATAGGAVVTSVTITGTVTSPDGTSNYTDTLGGSHQFTITGGKFSIGPVQVYDGYNNFYIYDTQYNSQSVTVYTANTVPKPKFVVITSPTGTNLSGLKAVTATIADPTGSGFAPDSVYGYASVGVYNAVTQGCDYTYPSYSNDVYSQVNYGDLPITFTPGSTSFTFNVDFSTGPGPGGDYCSTYLSVYAYDNTHYVSHGYSISVNASWIDTGYWYKAGAGKKASDAKTDAPRAEFLKRFIQRITP